MPSIGNPLNQLVFANLSLSDDHSRCCECNEPSAASAARLLARPIALLPAVGHPQSVALLRRRGSANGLNTQEDR